MNYIRDGRAPIPKNESTSIIMRANKAKNTKPEILLRKALWKNNLKGYRLNYKEIPGRPDIVFTAKKIAIFVHGCYWHRCPTCNLPIPKSNSSFWKTKFEKNVQRDKIKNEQLKELGWRILVIWECEIKENLNKQIDKIRTILL
jgi:DNA mismatch endonuclease (patch repair protein)